MQILRLVRSALEFLLFTFQLKSQEYCSLIRSLSKIKHELNCNENLTRARTYRYLNTLLPNMVVPSKDRCFARGSLKNKKMCLDNLGHKRGGPVGVWTCHNQGGNQAFYLSSQTNELRSFSHAMCVGVKNKKNELVTQKCTGKNHWRYDNTERTMIHIETGLCLTLEHPKTLSLSECGAKQEQKWDWSWKKSVV